MPTKPLSEDNKKQLVKDILGSEYHSIGNNWPVFSKVLDYVGKSSDVFTIAKLIPITNNLVAGSSTLSVIGSTAGALSIFLMPVGFMVAIINAWQSGHRDYTYRCVAYTITAWAFNQQRPMGSNQILHNMRSGILVRKQSIVGEFGKVWHETSISVTQMLEKILVEKHIQKKQLQFILQALGDGKSQQLCLLLLRGFEDKVDGYAGKLAWKSNYSITYPQ